MILIYNKNKRYINNSKSKKKIIHQKSNNFINIKIILKKKK